MMIFEIMSMKSTTIMMISIIKKENGFKFEQETAVFAVDGFIGLMLRASSSQRGNIKVWVEELETTVLIPKEHIDRQVNNQIFLTIIAFESWPKFFQKKAPTYFCVCCKALVG